MASLQSIIEHLRIKIHSLRAENAALKNAIESNMSFCVLMDECEKQRCIYICENSDDCKFKRRIFV
jgi:hypothetical protein